MDTTYLFSWDCNFSLNMWYGIVVSKVTDDVKRSLCSVSPSSFMAWAGSTNLTDYKDSKERQLKLITKTKNKTTDTACRLWIA